MTTIKIPRTLDSARRKLGGIDDLLTATNWERAAIVAAFTRTGGQGHKDRSVLLTTYEFAALGIKGLTSHVTVRRYRDAWLSTGREAAPGRSVDLDGLGPFPPDYEFTDPERLQPFIDAAEAETTDPKRPVGVNSAQMVATRLPAMRAAIRADTATATEAARALVETQPKVLEQVFLEHEHAKTADRRKRVEEWRREQKVPHPDDKPPGKLVSAMGDLGMVLVLGGAAEYLRQAHDMIALAGGVSDEALEDVAIHMDSIETSVREIRVLMGAAGLDAGLKEILGG